MAIVFYIALGLLLKFLWDVIQLLFSENYEAEFQYSTRILTARRHEEIQFQYRLASRRRGAQPRIPDQ